jgi:hypothetical protein
MLEDFGIKMNFANPQKHVLEAKHKVLVMDSAKKLNCFPTKQGISKYYSPRMIFHQKHLNYLRNCKYTFGLYVQAHNKPNPNNNLSPQTLSCIYLQYHDLHQGEHKLLHLPTKKIITRKNITPLLITKSIINQVFNIAISKSMLPSLKILSKSN